MANEANTPSPSADRSVQELVESSAHRTPSALSKNLKFNVNYKPLARGGKGSTDVREVIASPVVELIEIFGPKCGHKFLHEQKAGGKTVGGLGGAAAGAYIGAQVGIAAGPLGAMAATVPGAIFGALFGASKGSQLDRPKCKSCGTVFEMPK